MKKPKFKELESVYVISDVFGEPEILKANISEIMFSENNTYALDNGWLYKCWVAKGKINTKDFDFKQDLSPEWSTFKTYKQAKENFDKVIKIINKIENKI